MSRVKEAATAAKNEYGWKYCRDDLGNQVIVKVMIPARAKRLHFREKSRASEVKVLGIYRIKRHRHTYTCTLGKRFKRKQFAYSAVHRWSRTQYEVGKIVVPDWFDPNTTAHCSHGIHYHLKVRHAMSWVS